MGLPPPAEGRPVSAHFEIGGKRKKGGAIDIQYVALCPGADPLKPVFTVVEAQVKPCPKCRSTKGWRKLLFWRVLHSRKCETQILWRGIKEGKYTGFSMGVKARRDDDAV